MAAGIDLAGYMTGIGTLFAGIGALGAWRNTRRTRHRLDRVEAHTAHTAAQLTPRNGVTLAETIEDAAELVAVVAPTVVDKIAPAVIDDMPNSLQAVDTRLKQIGAEQGWLATAFGFHLRQSDAARRQLGLPPEDPPPPGPRVE